MTPSANTIPDSLDRMKDEMTVDIETPTAIYDHTTHFMMSAAAAAGAIASQMKLRNPNLALISGGASLAYLAAGMAMQRGDRRTSYRLGAASSIAMAVAFGPRVLGRQTIQQGAFDPISNALVSLSVFHGAHCLLNVYYQERRDKDRIVP